MNRHQYARALTAVYAKFEESEHPRDESGKFMSDLSFVPHPSHKMNPRSYTTIMADASKLDSEWSKDEQNYLPKSGVGVSEIRGRREEFEKFINKGKPIEQPKVVMGASGVLSFDDGRHRTRVLMNKGIKQIPITVPRGDAAKIRKLVGVE